MRPIGKKLTLVQDPSTGEFYHFDETGQEKFTLRRYLKLLMANLDLCKALVENFSNITDVDKCDSDLLPYIAALLAWGLNLDIPILGQRREVKSAVGVYKRKGTELGIQKAVAAIIGQEPVVEAMRFRILELNRSDRTLADTEDPFKWSLMNLPGDSNHYIPCLGDCIHDWNSFVIFIPLPLNEPLTRIKDEKLDRLMLLYRPINTVAYFILYDAAVVETFDVQVEITEATSDEEEVIEYYIRDHTLILNDTDHELNSTGSLLYTPWVTDEYTDEIIDQP